MATNVEQPKIQLAWGSYSELPTTSSEVGKIYFTKDEGSIYLGVDATKAPIRIQGVVQFYETTQEWAEAIKPPFSDKVIYYIAENEALLRWKWSESNELNPDGSLKGKFVQINVDMETFLMLYERVMGQETEIAKIQTIINYIWGDEGEIDPDDPGGLIGRVIALEEWKDLATQWQQDVDDWQSDVDDTLTSHAESLGLINKSLELTQSKADAQSQHEEIMNHINSQMKAADCMHFKDGVTDEDEIATIKRSTTNKVGDVYVALSNITISSGTNNQTGLSDNSTIYAGDLLVVIGTEDANGNVTSSSFNWTIINTGYQRIHDSVLEMDYESTKESQELSIGLTALGGKESGNNNFGDRGKFDVKTSGNLVLSTTDNQSFNLDLKWIAF